MSTLRNVMRREMRVALSRHAQPAWFRVVKWTCLLVGVALFHDRQWFWCVIAGLTAAAISLHLVYRWRTNVWTRAWGGWNDLDAGSDGSRTKVATRS